MFTKKNSVNKHGFKAKNSNLIFENIPGRNQNTNF